MLVRCLRALLLFVPLLFPALAFQSDLSGPSIQIVPARSREARPGEAGFPPATLRVDSSLVLIPAQVTTRDGSPILDLKRKDFRIFEDGAEQEISYFAKDDAPVSIGLLLDSSGSMRNKKQKSSEAAAAFFKTANSRRSRAMCWRPMCSSTQWGFSIPKALRKVRARKPRARKFSITLRN